MQLACEGIVTVEGSCGWVAVLFYSSREKNSIALTPQRPKQISQVNITKGKLIPSKFLLMYKVLFYLNFVRKCSREDCKDVKMMIFFFVCFMYQHV